jgi:predicted RNase H-like HicB family nuclease
MQDGYEFPAVLHYNSDGRIGIVFPDLPGCVGQASSDAEAVKKATEALELHLCGMEEDGDPIPQPSRPADVELGPRRRTILVTAPMPLVREDMETRATKKTLTIPAWLNRAAEASGVNFSALLQRAIKEHLGIDAARRM